MMFIKTIFLTLILIMLLGEYASSQNSHQIFSSDRAVEMRAAIQLQQEVERNSRNEISITTIRDDMAQVQTGIQNLENQAVALQLDVSQTNANIAEIKDHARSDLPSCAGSGKKLNWNGTSWVCAEEADPSVLPFAKAPMPGTCHSETAKLRWNSSAGAWECVAEGDPTVQLFAKNPLPPCNSNQLLRSNGTGLQCVVAGEDVTIAESDPKIGAVNNNKWCRGTGSQIVCDIAGDEMVETINNILSCGATHKTWNGSTCIGNVTNPIIATSLNFSQVNAANINTVLTSNAQTIDAGGAGLTTQATLSGPTNAVIMRGSTDLGRSAVLTHGDSIALRLTTGPTYDQTTAVSINVGGVVSTWSVQTRGDPSLWRRVFMTSTNYRGDLGGHIGADAKCQVRADAANLGGSWMALIGTSQMNVFEKLLANGGAKGWRLVDNRTVVFPPDMIGTSVTQRNPRMAPTAYIATNEFGNPIALNWGFWYGANYDAYHAPGVTLNGQTCAGPDNCGSPTDAAPFHHRPRAQRDVCWDWTTANDILEPNTNGQILGTATQAIPRAGSAVLGVSGTVTYSLLPNGDTGSNPHSRSSNSCRNFAALLCLEK
jgi:hypothetical protein